MYKVKAATEIIDKREILMRSAIKLFAENGFDAVTTRMIAADAGVNLALISYYFNSKDGLIDAIIEERIPVFGEKLRSIQNLNINSFEKLQLAIDAYIDRILSSGDFAKLIYRELSLKNRSHNLEKLMEAFKKNKTLLEDIIIEGQERKEFRSDLDYKMLLLSFFSTVIMLVNTTNVCAMVLNESKDNLAKEDFKYRVKTYFKQMFSQLNIVPDKIAGESVSQRV